MKKVLILMLLVHFNVVQSQDIKEYVKKNSTIINPNQPATSQLAKFDSIFRSKKYFLFGDGHQFNSDVLVQWFFLKYLYEVANVRNYIIERGPSEAYALNKYVIDGDSSFLKYTTDAFLELKSRRKFYQDVYEFNKSKIDKEKIRFYAFDHFVINNTGLLKIIFNKPTKPPASILPMIKKIMEADSQQNLRKQYSILLEGLQSDIKKYYNDYELFMGKNFYLLNQIVFNPINDKRNETRLFNAFKKLELEGQFQEGNFASQYGFGHAVLNSSKLLGGKLNTYLNDGVISFLPYYINSNGKYGKEENYYESWGADIYGKYKYKNNTFATEAASYSTAPIVLLDLRFLPIIMNDKRKLAAQFMLIFTESEAIH